MAVQAPAVSSPVQSRKQTRPLGQRKATPNSSWRSRVQAAADRIELELNVAARPDVTPPPGSDPTVVADGIRGRLALARGLSTPPVNPWSLLRGWWTGEDVERASAALNAANQALLMIQDDATVRALVPDILAAARAHLRSRDTRLIAFEEWLKRQRRNEKPPPPLSAEDREVLRITRAAADSAADQATMNLRGFRNVLVVSLLLLTVLVIGVGLAAVTRPELFSLCAPAGGPASGLPAGDLGGRCPSGEDRPSGNDAVHVMVLGAFGGAMAAVFTLSRMKGISGPFSLPSFQALLKLPAGSATALLGVLLLQNNMVTGFSPQRNGIISAYAVIFGYGQQVVTRLVDRQAGNVQGPARSRNDPAKPPVVEPGTTTVVQAEE